MLVDEKKVAGDYVTRWDGKDAQGRNLASGVYLCQIEAGSFLASKKMVLMR